ncbi:hypothetical protein HZA56_05215 [Candidatus Poribacteria bacterium]|nr:hypothetical protein [Candidatus Poribacteria bacterium]
MIQVADNTAEISRTSMTASDGKNPDGNSVAPSGLARRAGVLPSGRRDLADALGNTKVAITRFHYNGQRCQVRNRGITGKGARYEIGE